MSFGQFYRNASGDVGLRTKIGESETWLAGVSWFVLGQTDYLYHGYINFNNVTVPKNGIIYAAHVDFLPYLDQVTALTVTIYGDDSDDAVSPTSAAEFDALTRTTANVSWTVPNWANGVWTASIDIKAIIQEIVNRAGWASGANLALIFDATGAVAGRAAYGEYSVGGTFWPHLDITHEATATSPKMITVL